jgi:hypothetical protein
MQTFDVIVGMSAPALPLALAIIMLRRREYRRVPFCLLSPIF